VNSIATVCSSNSVLLFELMLQICCFFAFLYELPKNLPVRYLIRVMKSFSVVFQLASSTFSGNLYHSLVALVLYFETEYRSCH